MYFPGVLCVSVAYIITYMAWFSSTYLLLGVNWGCLFILCVLLSHHNDDAFVCLHVPLMYNKERTREGFSLVNQPPIPLDVLHRAGDAIHPALWNRGLVHETRKDYSHAILKDLQRLLLSCNQDDWLVWRARPSLLHTQGQVRKV